MRVLYMCACNANLSYKRSNSGIIKKNAIILTVSIIYLIFVAQKYTIISIKEMSYFRGISVSVEFMAYYTMNLKVHTSIE
jgi:hypothetical protein